MSLLLTREDPASSAGTENNEKQTLGLIPLVGLVIGSMVGSGAFNLMREMALDAYLIAIVVSWAIAGLGMFALVLCFLNLNKKRPDLKAGIFSYAREGFGKYMGFNSTWGYWLSALFANVAYGTILMSSLGFFFPAFDTGENLISVIGASIALWGITFLVTRGIRPAGLINAVVTAAKLIPIGLFIFAVIAAFKLDLFSSEVWGNAMTGSGLDWSLFMGQVKSTMFATVFVFIGVEASVVFSGRAKKSRDVSKATAIGFFTVLSVYILVTVLSFGVMTAPELANADQPAMATVLSSIVGEWGGRFVVIGVIVSVCGAWLAWTMNAVELPYQTAKQGDFPRIFAKANSRKAPVAALIITACVIQLFILGFLLPFGSSVYHVGASLCTAMALPPYAFTAFYQLKSSLAENKETPDRIKNIVIGVVASIYTVWLLYAGGLDYLLISMFLYALGIVAYVVTQKQVGALKVFTRREWVAVSVLIGLVVLGVFQVVTGQIDLANL